MPIHRIASVTRPLARSLLSRTTAISSRPLIATQQGLPSAPHSVYSVNSTRTMSSSSLTLPKPEPSPAGQVPGQGKPNLHLYTGPTPNGFKVSILLEELRAAYPEEAKNLLAYDVIPIDISTNVQKVSSLTSARACFSGAAAAVACSKGTKFLTSRLPSS